MSWAEVEYVVFDLEANADLSDLPAHEIIEIGAVLGSGGVETDAFQTLVRPTRPLRQLTRELTGLTDDDLVSAPLPADALRALYDFVGGRPMIAHNGLRYDFPLLESAGAESGVPMPGVTRLDTLELAHLVFPRAGAGVVANIDGGRPPMNRKLDGLAHHLLGEEQRGRHRALDDARLLHRVMVGLLDRLGGRGSARRLQRWVLGAGRHSWVGFVAARAEPVPLEKVIPKPDPPRRDPPTGGFDPRTPTAMLTAARAHRVDRTSRSARFADLCSRCGRSRSVSGTRWRVTCAPAQEPAPGTDIRRPTGSGAATTRGIPTTQRCWPLASTWCSPCARWPGR